MASITKKLRYFVALLAIFCPITLFATTPCQSNQQTWLYTVDTSNQSHIVACLTPSNGAIPWFGFLTSNTSATTVNFDASQGTTQTLTIATDVTSSTLSNPIVGQWMFFTVKEDGTGGHTFQQPANFVNWTPIDTTAGATTTEFGYFDGTYFQVVSGGSGSGGGTTGNCTASLASFSTFCGGPVPENGPLSPPLIQSNQLASQSAPNPTVSFLGPVAQGNQVLVLISAFCYPALDCNPTTHVGSDVSDTLGTSFSYAGHQGARYFGTDAYIGTATSSGADTVVVSIVQTGADVSIQEYKWLGTLDATGLGSTSSSGIYSASITTATNEDTLVAVTHSISTNSATDAVSIDPENWNILPLSHAAYGTYATVEYENSFAAVAGVHTERLMATNLGGLNATGATVIFAFKPSQSPRPTQAAPTFRFENMLDIPYQIVPLYGLSSSLGGSVLAAGACSNTTVAVTGAQTGNTVIVTPETYPGDGNYWNGYISAVNVVTVDVCSVAGGTPTASLYDVRVLR